MSIKGFSLNKFKAAYKPSLFTGVGYMKIARDSKGNMVINPTRKQLSEFLSNVTAEGEEFKYADKVMMNFGYTDYSDNGGKKRISEEEFKKLSFQEQEMFVVGNEVDYCRLSILMQGEIETKTEKGIVKETLYELVQFKFVNAVRFNSDGTKMQVFNTLGQIDWVGTDKVFKKGFNTTVDVFPAYDKMGEFGIEEFADFIYSYAAESRTEKGTPLLQYIIFDDLFKGDASSFSELMEAIEDNRIIEDNGKKIVAYGVMMLATPVNNKGTNNNNVQTFYPVFERGVENEKGDINASFNKIKKDIIKSRQPSKDGRIYSPEVKGIYVGPGGVPTLGFKRVDESVMEAFILANTNNTSSRPITTRPAGGQSASNTPVEDNPFGI